MQATTRRHLPTTTRRTFVLTTGLATLGALVLGASRKAEPAIAAAVPLLRPEVAGTSAGRCAHCGSTAHTTLSPACEEGAAPRRILQGEARRRAAAHGGSPR
jgi:hypothetical protein